jgi:thymidylate kinase
MMIALEGIKGSGKSTIFSEVVRQLSAEGWRPHIFQPTATRKDSWLDTLHKRFGNYLPAWLIEKIYIARANEAATRLPKRGLVLAERCIFTSYVTRWNYISPEKGLWQIDLAQKLNPIPSHVIFLDVPIPVAIERINTRKARRYGIKDQSEMRLAEARFLYQTLSQKAPQYGLQGVAWHWIDAAQPKEAVIQQTMTVIRGILAQPVN